MEKINQESRSALAGNSVDVPSVDDLLPEDEKESYETSASPRLSKLVATRGASIEIEEPSLPGVQGASFRSSVNSRLIVKPESRLVIMNPKDPAGTEFALLAARLSKLKTQNHLKRVLVAGCEAGGGGSLVCANLALALAQNPTHKVLLIEGNLDHPSLATRFGLEAPKGLAEYLMGNEPLERTVRYLSPGGIWFISAGTPPRDKEERFQILRSPRLPILFRRDLEWFDWVIVDSPPLESRLTAGAFTRVCDGLVVVVRKGYTTRKTLKQDLDMLEGAPILGYALNEWVP